MTIKEEFIEWYTDSNGEPPNWTDCRTMDEWGAFACGYAIGEENKASALKSEAIKHGAAYYHPETGEFTWKGEETE